MIEKLRIVLSISIKSELERRPKMNRAIAIVLLACILAGCQRGITNQQAQYVREAIVTQQNFHAKRGDELQRQYERAKKELPVLARYVTLQERRRT